MTVLPWPYLPKDRHEKFIELLDAFGLAVEQQATSALDQQDQDVTEAARAAVIAFVTGNDDTES